MWKWKVHMYRYENTNKQSIAFTNEGQRDLQKDKETYVKKDQ